MCHKWLIDGMNIENRLIMAWDCTKKAQAKNYNFIVANCPETSGTVPEIEIQSPVPHRSMVCPGICPGIDKEDINQHAMMKFCC